MKTTQEKAIEALNYFTVKTFEDGRSIIVMTDDAPEWVSEMVYKAHEGFMPDDYRYAFIVEALEIMSATADDEYIDSPDIEADIYTSDLLAWLSSNFNRIEYTDEAIKSMGAQDTTQMLIAGQVQEKEEVYHIVLNYLQQTDLEVVVTNE